MDPPNKSYSLPSGNHEEAAVSQQDEASAPLFDRRSIPVAAYERRWSAPDEHAIRQLDWPAPEGHPRGSLLFMPGRGDAYEKYLDSLEHWRRQGWQVSAADWRGQAGSGRLGRDALVGHVDDFALWVDDLAAFWRDWSRENARSNSGPPVLIGHSMGGHLALRAVAEGALDPAPAALVLSAPMLDVLPERLPVRLKHWVARSMAVLGDSRRAAWKSSEKPGQAAAARQLLLTHDDARYADELWWRGQRPELVMGPASWGWVAGAMRSIRALERPGVLERVRLPVFIVATVADRLVGTRAIARAAARLPDSRVLWFGTESRHEILREIDSVRTRALAGIDAFLDTAVPG